MAIEVGAKVTGKVSGITNFGAFVDLGDHKTGLVHISEISDGYVKDIHDVLSVGDEVTVKVLTVGDDGKIGLSIRKATDHP
ncbi:S1 RNA-binding domain-containing protein, partial [Levilactobacillus spicheri]